MKYFPLINFAIYLLLFNTFTASMHCTLKMMLKHKMNNTLKSPKRSVNIK